ncbi:hypothetical protein Taro_029728 [Colocasia esculenta]|uniref:Aminotransferase-like plant mobile domain-containing protein n=1 Tax=Colocasia esculenta TaxID=4460 RepID=A0A843VKJ0_COLES|nr:hypothetical protein [Colocasia esculenta]
MPQRLPSTADLGVFSRDLTHYTWSRMISPAKWNLKGRHRAMNQSNGLLLMPCNPRYNTGGYDNCCLLDRIIDHTTPSWYGRWSVMPSHVFHYGATEWLMGILHHHGKLLRATGIYGAIEAALFDYPCYTGILQALVERFNVRWNTFGTAEGETSLDLWSFHRISGLPISGHFYEEVVLNDLHSFRTNGRGQYILPYSLRFLMKVWRDLARAERIEKEKPATRTVSQNAWVRYFYNGPFCFFDSFAVEGRPLEHYRQLEAKKTSRGRYIFAPKNKGWNPRRLPDRTYLAAYLVYWLSSFVVPHGEEEGIRPGLIYPVCLLAEGHQLAIAPATLANIFHRNRPSGDALKGLVDARSSLVSDICKIDSKELMSPPLAQTTAIPVLRIGGNRDHEARSRAFSSRDMKVEKGKVVAYCSPNDDEVNDEYADLIASDEYTPLLGDSFLPYGMEYGSFSRAGGDLTSEVGFTESSSHCLFPEAGATGHDDSASAYAEYKAFVEQYPFTPVDAYIPRPDGEYPAAEAASSGGQPFCDQLLSWGVMDSYSLPATSSPFLSWDGLGSSFFMSQAYSAFQVGDSADDNGPFGQEFYAEESNSVQPSVPESKVEARHFLPSNPSPSDFNDGGSPPLGLEALSEHGVDWPSRDQPTPSPEDEDLWNFLVGRVRAVVDSEDPPSIDAVKRVLKEKTMLAFNSGIAENIWMSFVGDI